MTIGEVIANYESTAASVSDDQAALAAASAQLEKDAVAASDAADAVTTGLPKVGGAAFNADRSKVYIADLTAQGFFFVVPADPSTECDPDAKPKPVPAAAPHSPHKGKKSH